MTSLQEAINKSNMTTTANGDLTHLTSANDFVDMFFKIGASRGNPKPLFAPFQSCIKQDLGLAMRLLFWARDIRGGAGERDMYRSLVRSLFQHAQPSVDNDIAKRIALKTVEVGRWDDLLDIFYGTYFESVAFDLIEHALKVDKNGLCAKWMPREKSSKRAMAHKLRTHMGLTSRQYRKLLVYATEVVETQMCERDWSNIEFSKVPSQAVNIYRGAFSRHAPTEWETFLEEVESGETTINAGAVYPYQLISGGSGWGATYMMDKSQIAQWNSLPDYTEGKEGSILPVVDVSGSMMTPAGPNTSVSCMQVAVSIGLYLSERLNGPFKDSFITFSTAPKLQTLTGDVTSRLHQLQHAHWGMSTNLDAVFNTLLTSAVKFDVSPADMPTTVLILSDMQFNSAIRRSTAQDRIEQMYEDASVKATANAQANDASAEPVVYKAPNIVYWNISASSSSPVTYDQSGAALVSGFSPSIVKSILSAEDLTPVNVMMKTLLDKRYNW